MLSVLKIVFLLILLAQGLCSDIESRIVNGIVAEDFIPYQASIRVTIRDQVRFGQGHTCGGVLISTRTVTTAAHCLFDAARQRNAFDLRVVLGSLNRWLLSDDTVVRTVEKIIVHPSYRRGESFANDIGLIILRSPVKITDIVHSIPIIDHAVADFTNCQISGWGATQWQTSMPAELRKANVSIVSRSFCTRRYVNTFVDGMVCANGINDDGIIDVCQGDSGGPLMCDGKLVGLASFGVQCGFSIEYPGVFTDVFFYRDWIEENMSGGNKLKAINVIIISFISSHIMRFFY